jgi:membrane protein YdbS with pleckstrin-like domain
VWKGEVYMSMNPKIKNPLILTIVSTVFLIPVLILTHYLFRESAVNPWIIMVVNVVIYFIVIFLVFLFYGNVGRKS